MTGNPYIMEVSYKSWDVMGVPQSSSIYRRIFHEINNPFHHFGVPSYMETPTVSWGKPMGFHLRLSLEPIQGNLLRQMILMGGYTNQEQDELVWFIGTF